MSSPMPPQPFRVAVLKYGRFPVLSETFIISQVTGFLDAGCTVDVLASAPGKTTFDNDDVANYNLLGKCKFALPGALGGWSGKLTALRWLLGAVFSSLIFTPIFWRCLNIRRYGRNVPLLLGSLRTLSSNPAAYDAIVCHFGPSGLLALQMREVGLLRGPIHTFFHGYDISRFVQAKGPNVYAQLFRHGTSFLAVSEYFKARLLALGAPAEKIHVLVMGISPQRFPHLLPQSLGPQGCRVLTVGRLTEKKGVHIALQALALLKDDLAFTYIIAGDGDQRVQLETLTDALGLSPRVTFLGAVSQVRVAQLLAEADVFVHPCVTAKNGDQEGLPLTIKEAMARGVPVVGSTHGGMGEMITHGVDGLLAPEHDVPTLATLLKQVMAPTPESMALRQTLSTNARHTVETRYDVATLNHTLLTWLKEHARTVTA